VTGVAIKRFFEIAISSREIGGAFTPRARVLPIAQHHHRGSIKAALIDGEQSLAPGPIVATETRR
jgi:hypothetical protein